MNINMEPDKNIQLTVLNPQMEDDEIIIDLREIVDTLKRFFVLWLAAALCVGCIAGGIGILLRPFYHVSDARALIEYSADEETAQLVNISNLMSPNIIEQAMKSLDLNTEELDNVRTNLSLTGVMSDDAYDKVALYYELLSLNSANLNTVDTIMNANEKPTRFIVTFDYMSAGYDRETGIQLLDEILKNYRKFFDRSYNANVAIGNAISVVDYSSYDYAEAVEVFRGVLDNAAEYLETVSGVEVDENGEETPGLQFRSTVTGYKISDLQNRVQLLRDVELNRIASFVDINSVTVNDPTTEVSRYEWLIEQETREKSVLTATLNSLTGSIGSYEKDPVVYSEKEKTEEEEEIVDAYDSMILKKIELQDQISNLNTSIRYNESVIEKLKKTKKVQKANLETADEYMASFNEKLTTLMDDVNNTMNEYFEKAVKPNTLTILVPATARSAHITDVWVKPALIAEAVVLLAYLACAVIYAINKMNPRKVYPEAVETKKLTTEKK